MKLAILSRNAKLYSTQRLVQAGRDSGHTVRVLDPLERFSEIVFGLIMVLSITDSMSVAGSGKKAASGAC